jgi:HPt (histidine-containing phosphotransfer) domain-containing protein
MNEDLIIDYDLLKSLLNNNEQLASRYLAAFKKECGQLLDNIRQSFASGDATSLSRSSHTIKTQFRMMGVDSLVQLARQIEQRAEANKVDDETGLQIAHLVAQTNEMIRINGLS